MYGSKYLLVESEFSIISIQNSPAIHCFIGMKRQQEKGKNINHEHGGITAVHCTAVQCTAVYCTGVCIALCSF